MDENLQCRLCPYIAPRSARLKKHMEVKHLWLRIARDLCDYTSTAKSNLKKHKQQIHEQLKYTCIYCGKIFINKHCFKRHINFIHLNLPRPILSCPECGKSFIDKNTLKRHTNEHLGVSYPCERCEYKTKVKSNLKHHMKSHHEKREWFLCDLCEYKGSRKGLRGHKESKHAGKTFKCHICEYVVWLENQYLMRLGPLLWWKCQCTLMVRVAASAV